jgi:hypothetical protein
VYVLAKRLSRPRYVDDRAFLRTAPRKLSAADIRPRVVDDGIWWDTGGIPFGSTVHYRYLVHGAAQTGRFTVEPSSQEQFVFTGGTPAAIEIIEVLPPSGREARDSDDFASSADFPAPPPQPREEPSPAPFTGYPSAY